MEQCKWCNFQNDSLKIKDYHYWTLYLADSQFILGWSHAVLKRHVKFFEELTDDELKESKKVITELKRALAKTFKPDWFNVMQLGNMDSHLHLHLVPRYKDKRIFWERTFIDHDWGKMIVDRWKPEEKEFLQKITEHIKNAFN